MSPTVTHYTGHRWNSCLTKKRTSKHTRYCPWTKLSGLNEIWTPSPTGNPLKYSEHCVQSPRQATSGALHQWNLYANCAVDSRKAWHLSPPSAREIWVSTEADFKNLYANLCILSISTAKKGFSTCQLNVPVSSYFQCHSLGLCAMYRPSLGKLPQHKWHSWHWQSTHWPRPLHAIPNVTPPHKGHCTKHHIGPLLLAFMYALEG